MFMFLIFFDFFSRINSRTDNGNLGMYLLIPLLNTEDECLPLQGALASEGKLRKLQRNDAPVTQKFLFAFQ